MDQLERAAEFFRTAHGAVAAYAFGSVPEGRAHGESDLDLAVLLDWNVYPDRRARGNRQVALISALIGALALNEIDLIILNDAPPLLARRIVREGRRLHSANPESVHDFERDVQLRAADVEPFVRRWRARLLEKLERS